MKLRKTDWLIYVTVGLVLVYIGAVVSPPSPKGRKAIELALTSLVLFGYIVKFYWRHRPSTKLWFLLIAVLVAHSLLCFAVYATLEQIPLVVCFAGVVAEFLVIETCIYLTVGIAPG